MKKSRRSRHLVAVQPFTVLGSNQFIGDPNIDILNGHYTTVNNRIATDLPFALDLGALSQVQLHGKRTKLFGFNETLGRLPAGSRSGGSLRPLARCPLPNPYFGIRYKEPGNGGSCEIVSPFYSFDMVMQVQQVAGALEEQ